MSVEHVTEIIWGHVLALVEHFGNFALSRVQCRTKNWVWFYWKYLCKLKPVVFVFHWCKAISSGGKIFFERWPKTILKENIVQFLPVRVETQDWNCQCPSCKSFILLKTAIWGTDGCVQTRISGKNWVWLILLNGKWSKVLDFMTNQGTERRSNTLMGCFN